MIIRKIIITCFLLILLPLLASADTLILKNGKRIKTQGTWEEGDLIKCFRYGSIVGYPKEDVERIEKEQFDTKKRV